MWITELNPLRSALSTWTIGLPPDFSQHSVGPPEIWDHLRAALDEIDWLTVGYLFVCLSKSLCFRGVRRKNPGWPRWFQDGHAVCHSIIHPTTMARTNSKPHASPLEAKHPKKNSQQLKRHVSLLQQLVTSRSPFQDTNPHINIIEVEILISQK